MPPKSLRWAKSKHNRAKLSFSLLFGARPSSSLFGAPSVRDPHPCARFASLRAICILASHLYPCEPSASLCPIRIPAHDLHSLARDVHPCASSVARVECSAIKCRRHYPA